MEFFNKIGGQLPFAAECTNGSNAQVASFANFCVRPFATLYQALFTAA